MPAIEHPLLAEADAFIAALLAFEASIPEPSRDAGALEIPAPDKHKRRPPRNLGTVWVPGSGQHVDPNVVTNPRGVPNGSPVGGTNSGPNTGSLEGLPNSGGGGGGAW